MKGDLNKRAKAFHPIHNSRNSINLKKGNANNGALKGNSNG
jgi:hypothetical protein